MGINIVPNYDDAVEFTPLPAGTYKARIVDCKEWQSKAANPMAKWTLKTFGSETKNHNDQNIWHNTPLTGKGAGILKQFIRAATGEEPVPGPFNSDILMGRTVKVTVVEGLKQDGSKSGYAEVKAIETLRD